MNNRKWNFFSHFQASVKKTSFSKSFSFSPRVSNLIFKQEMESFRQEMELFFTLWGLLSKNFFFQNLSRLIQEIQNLHLSWLILTYLNLPWPILTNLDKYWPVVTYLDPFQLILTHLDPYWIILTYIDLQECFAAFSLSCLFCWLHPWTFLHFLFKF